MKKSGKITLGFISADRMRGAICEQKICSDSHEKTCFLHLADCQELKIHLEVNPPGSTPITMLDHTAHQMGRHLAKSAEGG